MSVGRVANDPSVRFADTSPAKLGRIAKQQHRFFALCVAPSLAVLALITLLPALYLLATSFTPLNLPRPETLGDFAQALESYRQLLSDSRLHNSVWVQIKLSFWTVALQLLM